jgi:hypothetical protein
MGDQQSNALVLSMIFAMLAVVLLSITSICAKYQNDGMVKYMAIMTFVFPSALILLLCVYLVHVKMNNQM